MEEVGKYLKSARENLNLSLDEVAEKTKIHKYKLEAIENGDRSSLPAKVFCVGLIKSYARELKVDMSEVDRLCNEAFSEPTAYIEPVEETPSETEEVAIATQSVGLFQVPKILTYASGVIVSLVLVVGIYLVISKINSYSQEKAEPVIETPVESISLTEGEKGETLPSQADEPEVESKDKPDNKIAKVTSDKPEPTPKVNAREPIKDEVDDNNFEAPEPATTSQTNSQQSNQAKVVSDNKLILIALEPIRVEIVWADGYVQAMLLKSQEKKTLVFSKPITVKVNNGGAVQVSFNESELNVPGSFNQPLEITYP